MENRSHQDWKALPQRSIFQSGSSNLQGKEQNKELISGKNCEYSLDDESIGLGSTQTYPVGDSGSSTQRLDNLSGYEYLDHTADVQIHCWGSSWETVFEAAGLALFGYMTDLKAVRPDPVVGSVHIRAQGHDVYSLLYKFLDECLFQYGANYIILCQLKVTRVQLDDTFVVEAIGQGEVFDPHRHPQGTEIKAITYSAMQIIAEDEADRIHMYFIVDI
ncbi:hypothetical protein GpartN1_g1478.t1 [Galdieria partita]|uniref:Archease domain-containing protein n=1 Tax=Galdieria partita TaxID=83374 RepID=A0A9C7PU65_9RHOD|nr:hypothetical protein GpartN1_g1478.t1 [Galdieria partita]